MSEWQDNWYQDSDPWEDDEPSMSLEEEAGYPAHEDYDPAIWGDYDDDPILEA